ncbi:MAG: hypothetical protein ABIE94_02735 [archaeon]
MNLKETKKFLEPRKTTISVEMDVQRALNELKTDNKTFNDVLKDLLQKSTISAGNENIKAIKYARTISFFTYEWGVDTIGFEFEYNEIKGTRTDFTLDLKIKKVFFNKRVFTPSEFFGTDNTHKHFYEFFLLIYFKAIAWALYREFRIKPDLLEFNKDFLDIARWGKIYHDYNLSEDSFKEDIAEPLRLSEEEKPSSQWKKKIEDSVAHKLEKKWDG